MPAVIHPKFHHLNLKTTRLDRDDRVVQHSRRHGDPLPRRRRRLALQRRGQPPRRAAVLSQLHRRSEKETRTGLHHSAFEYDSFDELNATYLRLRDAGIEPAFCIDHGMTFSYYYADPDGNHVELQADNFGDWAKSSEWMRTSEQFHANPIGVFVDPARVAEAAADGATFADIHARATAGEFAPEGPTPLDALETEG